MKPTLILTLVLTFSALSACAPVLIGAAGVVVADKIVEKEEGGDGLF